MNEGKREAERKKKQKRNQGPREAGTWLEPLTMDKFGVLVNP